MNKLSICLTNFIAPLFAPEVYAANEDAVSGGAGQPVDFRKMVCDLLGIAIEKADSEVMDAANACMADKTDYAGMKLKHAANEVLIPEIQTKLSGSEKMVLTLTGERDAANEKLVKVEASVGTLTIERDAANEKVKMVEASALSLTGERDAANEKATKTQADLDAQTKAREGAELQVANERKVSGSAILKFGVETGRITLAESKTLETDVANSKDFAGFTAGILGKSAKWRNPSITAGVGERSTEGIERSQLVLKAVNELMVANEKVGKEFSYDFCFGEIKRTKPEYFEGMIQSEASKALDAKARNK